MNRRELLKGLSALPLAATLASCHEKQPAPTEAPKSSGPIKTLQILFEGAFTLVIQKEKGNRVTAFVPIDPDEPHVFYFNDPQKAQTSQKSFHFELAPDGFETSSEPYINPGFADLTFETDVWRREVQTLVTVDVPAPNSINFTGRPLHIVFASGKPGLMATNFIFEYKMQAMNHLKMSSPQFGEHSAPSPNCPPGIARYFFGVAPANRKKEHSVDFFNFILQSSFPNLAKKFDIKYIEETKYPNEGMLPARVTPASLEYGVPRAQLRRVASTVDCQSIGPIVRCGC